MLRPAIVVLCYNRPDFLARTLHSLLSLRQISHYDVYVSQDGGHEATQEVASKVANQHPTLVSFWQKERPEFKVDDPKVPAWGFVAQHYKWVLDRIFEDENHSHVIIVEDDMELAVDFLTLFEKTAYLLDKDPTLMCVSSWNDNSRGKVGADKALLMRTSYFPGLGWMMKRNFYLETLQPGWPILSHWDNWLRANVHDFDCISPSLPRNRNFGSIGASMNTLAFKRDIATVHFYDAKEEVDFGDLSYLLNDNYEQNMADLLEQSLRLDEPELKDANAPPGMVYLLLYGNSPQFVKIAKFFGLWTHPRAHYRFLQVVEFQQNIYLIADVRFCPLLPSFLAVQPSAVVRSIAADMGQDCVNTCAAKELICSQQDMPWLNSCKALKKHFPCEKGCILETGGDIPSYVSGDIGTHGFCVTKMHNDLILCNGLHLGTSRLCACVPRP